MRIYFAGKIGKSDWRSELFGDRAGATDGGFGAGEGGRILDPTYTEDMGGGVMYGGPFFISCDHGCAHGPLTHGVGANRGWVGTPPNEQSIIPDLSQNGLTVCATDVAVNDRPVTKQQILRINNTRIQRADWVFAHIDCQTAPKD